MTDGSNGSPGNGRPRLAHLAIRDFRGIESLDLDFRDGAGEPVNLAVIAGDSGSGKTSVLEAILLAVGRQDLWPEDAAPLREQVRFGAETFEVQAELVGGGLDPSVQLHADIRTLEQRPPPPGYLAGAMAPYWLELSRLDLEVEYFSARREPEALGSTSDPRGPRSQAEARRVVELKRRLISAYYRALRKGTSPSESSDSPFARLSRLWSTFHGGDQRLDVIPLDNDPGSGDEVVVRENRPIPDDVTSLAMARELAPHRADIPRIVPIDRLSSGEVALFAFAQPLIFRDRPVDLVLIDEPEQHLHLLWHRLVIDALRDLAPQAQFIVATHSPEILDAATTAERFVLVDDDDPRETDDREPPAPLEDVLT